MTNNKPRHRRFTIAAPFRPTGGTLLIVALLMLACDMALGGGPAMAAAIYTFFIEPLVSFNDFLFNVFDAITAFFQQLPNELNPVS